MMTTFQQQVAERLREVALQHGLDLRFEERGVHAVARFDWQGEERLLLVADGELILEWEGENYFEIGEDSAHIKVRRFVEQFRLCLGGATADEAYRLAKLHGEPAR